MAQKCLAGARKAIACEAREHSGPEEAQTRRAVRPTAARQESAEAVGPFDRFSGALAAPQKNGLRGKIGAAAGGLVPGFRINNSLVL